MLPRSASYPAISTMIYASTSISNVSSDAEASISDHKLDMEAQGIAAHKVFLKTLHGPKYQQVSIAPWPVFDEEARKKLRHVKMSRPAFLKRSEELPGPAQPIRKFSKQLATELDKVQNDLERLLENVSTGLSKEPTKASSNSIYLEVGVHLVHLGV